MLILELVETPRLVASTKGWRRTSVLYLQFTGINPLN